MDFKDFIKLSDLDSSTIEKIATRAIELSADWKERKMSGTLSGARVGLIEELPGWRNPAAISLGGATMGAHVVQLNAKLEGSELTEDLAAYLENWFDLIAIRTPSLEKLERLAAAATIPVINLRTNSNHPCEILGDLTYIKNRLGTWDNLNVVVVGPDANILRSWVEAANVLAITVTQLAPQELHFDNHFAKNNITATDNLDIIKNSHVIITDCWPNSANTTLKTTLEKYRIDEKILSKCKSEMLFIPCPPVTRGEEVTSGAMLDARCCSIAAKAFLLHAQNAIMEMLYKNNISS